MPVTFDNKATGQTQGTALQFNLTAAANATLLVFAGNGFGHSVSAIAYAGVALTQKAVVINADNDALNLWVLSSPASGNNVLSAQFVGTSSNWGMIGITYTNAKASGTFGTPSSATSAAATHATISLSSTTTDLMVAAFMTVPANATPNFSITNGTTRGSATASNDCRIAVADIAGALSVQLSASVSATTLTWTMLAIPVVFSAASVATSPFNLALTGCGI